MIDSKNGILRIAGITMALSAIGYIVFPPFYETGTARIYVPVIGAVQLIAAVSLLLGRQWFQKWLRPYAAGTLAISVLFFGQSQETYGQYASAMIVVESLLVVSSLFLLIYSFTKVFDEQPHA